MDYTGCKCLCILWTRMPCSRQSPSRIFRNMCLLLSFTSILFDMSVWQMAEKNWNSIQQLTNLGSVQTKYFNTKALKGLKRKSSFIWWIRKKFHQTSLASWFINVELCEWSYMYYTTGRSSRVAIEMLTYIFSNITLDRFYQCNLSSTH